MTKEVFVTLPAIAAFATLQLCDIAGKVARKSVVAIRPKTDIIRIMVVITTNLHPLDDGNQTLPSFAPVYEMAQTVDRFNVRLRALFKDAQHKFTADQWHVLHTIAVNRGLSQNELKVLVNKDKPTISRMIDVLERRNLVERNRSAVDRRRFELSLTTEGQAVYDEMQPKVVAFVNRFLSPISEEDQAHFHRILAQINAGLEEE